MGTILVTGSTGFLGNAVVNYLRARQHDVREASRAETGNLSGCTAWGRMTQGVESIVHCAALAHVTSTSELGQIDGFRHINTDATVALAKAAVKCKVKRLVFISSIGVNGTETNGRAFAATDTPHPTSAYAISKHEAELALAKIADDSNLEVVIIRPPLILGAHAKGNLQRALVAMQRGHTLPLGLVTQNRRDIVSINNLANLIQVCTTHPAASGKIFLVSDGRSRSTREIFEEVARLGGVKPRFLPIPTSLLRFGLNLLGKNTIANQLLGNLEINMSDTQNVLNWAPQ